MAKKTTIGALMVLLFCWGGTALAVQEKAEDHAKATAQEPERQGAYRLDFSVNELQDGKKINTRQYSINLNAGDENEIKIGTRVPVETTNGQFQYIDVGTNIWARLRERGGELSVNAHADISDFAMPDQQAQIRQPIIRQLKINGSTIALPGKPIVIGSVDDPNSKRQFQLEMTVTKLR
jgi:hypothetical protein